MNEAGGRKASESYESSDTFTYAYVANSDLIDEIRVASRSFVGKKKYEPNRDVITSVDNQVSGSTISKYAYTYDALGRRADREQSGSAFAQTNTDTFSYNTRSEVTGSTNNTLAGDATTPPTATTPSATAQETPSRQA